MKNYLYIIHYLANFFFTKLINFYMANLSFLNFLSTYFLSSQLILFGQINSIEIY